MLLKKYRWSRTYEAAEEELLEQLKIKHIDAERREAEPGEVFEPHVHPKDKTLWCAEGSITLTVLEQRISLQPGDALQLPAYTMHEAAAGLSGCVCYEYPRRKDNPPENQ